MNIKFIRKTNLTVINFILLFVTLSVCAYVLIASNKLLAAFIVLILLSILTVFNVIVYFAKQRERIKRIKLLTFYAEGNLHPGPGAIAFFRLPLAFLSEDGTF